MESKLRFKYMKYCLRFPLPTKECEQDPCSSRQNYPEVTPKKYDRQSFMPVMSEKLNADMKQGEPCPLYQKYSIWTWWARFPLLAVSPTVTTSRENPARRIRKASRHDEQGFPCLPYPAHCIKSPQTQWTGFPLLTASSTKLNEQGKPCTSCRKPTDMTNRISSARCISYL